MSSYDSTVNNAHISTHAITSNPLLFNPARNNTFQFVVNAKLNKLIKDPAKDGNYLKTTQDVLEVAVIEASVPNFKLDPIEVRRGNSQVKFAGTPSFEAGSLKLEDYVGARVKDILYGWQALAYDVASDVVFDADKYKFDCDLVEYNPEMTKVVRRWKLIGCWISSISEESFNHENHDKRTLSATVEYDRAYRDYSDSIYKN